MTTTQKKFSCKTVRIAYHIHCGTTKRVRINHLVLDHMLNRIEERDFDFPTPMKREILPIIS